MAEIGRGQDWGQKGLGEGDTVHRKGNPGKSGES